MRLPGAAPRAAISAEQSDEVLWKMDAAGQPVRQIELCDAIAAALIAPQRNLRLLAFLP